LPRGFLALFLLNISAENAAFGSLISVFLTLKNGKFGFYFPENTIVCEQEKSDNLNKNLFNMLNRILSKKMEIVTKKIQQDQKV
jgi:hypothetical protein